MLFRVFYINFSFGMNCIMTSSTSDFSGPKIDLDKWDQNIFDNSYYLWRNAYARLDDVNFVGNVGRGDAYFFAELSNIIHSGVRCSIYLYDIERISLGNGYATTA